MVTLKRDIPPEVMEIGVKLLLISAGYVNARTVVTGPKKSEPIKASTNANNLNDFNIQPSLRNEWIEKRWNNGY